VKPYRRRFLAAHAALGLVGTASVGTGWHAVTATTARAAPCVPLTAAQDPIVTAITFIRTAVERTDPAGSYGLVIPALREGISCREWASGALPVHPFDGVDWDRASYRLTASGTGQLVFDVTLVPRAKGKSTGHFLLELRQLQGRWLVGFWDAAAPADHEQSSSATDT
jgi:hypothetical protein